MGLLISGLSQSFPPKSKFAVSDIPDLSDQVIIVTGASTGIGFDTAQALLEHNAKVYIAARNEEKAKAAIVKLKQETGKDIVHFLLLDLADLHSVKRAAEEFARKETQLHALFNNGGVMVPPVDQLTTQGYDLQWGTNVLGHFYFTKLLLPILTATAPTTPSKTARVIHTASFASYMPSRLDFNTFKDSPARKRMGVNNLYSQSKLGNAIFSNELARRFRGQGIVSVAVNPGNLKTELQRHLGSIGQMILNTILYPAPFGALTQLWAGTTDAGMELNGKFAVPWARVGPMPYGATDESAAKALWDWLEEQVANV
ncbi:NAD(P)-binding protein [Mycena indigotica]|uniref:NAD(P)-binding protein n=1 Tax=Mycena indigotica TaxID=2126181 RepID=A0A8H6SHQ9_9AGAR|nr:NAD(P)-binding protein [Mycena indigotica]KAF7299010.1 NAD(P)-binding protein [Mycena indigotica]